MSSDESTEASGWSFTAWNVFGAMIGFSISTFIVLVLLILFIYTLKPSNTLNSKKKRSMKMQFLSIMTLLTLFTTHTFRLFDWFGFWVKWNEYTDCATLVSICYINLTIHKTLLSAIYVSRLHLVYQDTEYEQPISTRIILWTAVILYPIVFSFLTLYALHIDKTAIIVAYRDTDIKTCGGDAPWYALGPWIAFEAVFPIVTLVFFIKPLCTMSKLNETQGEIGQKFQKTATKYCIITNTAIISTLIVGVTYGYFGILFTGAVDAVINSHCIIFYESRFAAYYDIVCAPINRPIELWRKMKHSQTLQLKPNSKSDTTETKETSTTTEKSNLDLQKLPPTIQIVKTKSSDTGKVTED